jgi:TRIAD3 protein (E3 ubiquitin-protein ligase RNF216)
LNFIDSALLQCGYRLYSTYLLLEEAHRTFDARHPTYNKIKKANKTRRIEDAHTEANLEATIQAMLQSGYQAQDAEVLRELQAARRKKRKTEAKLQAERLFKIEEEKNLLRAQAEGTMSECECCFSDAPLNRMVHCDSDPMHFFCRQCATSTAETEIGNSKYILSCMSMDGCEGGFSMEQRYGICL